MGMILGGCHCGLQGHHGYRAEVDGTVQPEQSQQLCSIHR